MLTSLPILLYHHVGPRRIGTNSWLTVEPGRFASHVTWLQDHGYRSATSDQVIVWVTEGRPLPPRCVLLTFDDAYGDLAEHAFPVLSAAGYSALVFVVTGRIGGVNEWDAPHTRATHALLGADAIRRWSAEGIEFGAHSRTHPDLTRLTERQLDEEVVGSKNDLEALLGGPVRTFAYPYGSADQASRRVVAGAFALAFTDADGVNQRAGDPHLIRRTCVSPLDGTFDIATRVRIGQSPNVRARSWVDARLKKLPALGAALRSLANSRHGS